MDNTFDDAFQMYKKFEGVKKDDRTKFHPNQFDNQHNTMQFREVLKLKSAGEIRNLSESEKSHIKNRKKKQKIKYILKQA